MSNGRAALEGFVGTLVVGDPVVVGGLSFRPLTLDGPAPEEWRWTRWSRPRLVGQEPFVIWDGNGPSARTWIAAAAGHQDLDPLLIPAAGALRDQPGAFSPGTFLSYWTTVVEGVAAAFDPGGPLSATISLDDLDPELVDRELADALRGPAMRP